MGDRAALFEQLVDDGDLNALFQLVTVDDVAAAWCLYASSGDSYDPYGEAGNTPNWWAVQLLMENEIYQYEDGRAMREVLLALVRHADDDTLGDIGAGPMENFLSDDPEGLQWLEEQCRSDERFRRALSFSWYSRTVSEATAERLDRAAGKSTHPHTGD